MRGAVEWSELVRWAACGAVVVLAHASTAAVVATWTNPLDSAETTGAITIDLGPVVTSTAASQEDLPPGPQMQAAPPAEQTPESKPDEKQPDAPKPDQVAVIEPQVEPKPPEEKRAEPPPPVEKAEVALPEPPKPVKPRARPKSPRPPAPATTAPPRSPRVAALSAAPTQGQLSASADGKQTWTGQLFAAIARQKRPGEMPHLGRPVVSFMIDRHGRLLSSSVSNSSGVPALDQEALAMVRRAQFPPAPAEVIGVHHNFSVPVTFR
jgi:periplasmic protein TonB